MGGRRSVGTGVARSVAVAVAGVALLASACTSGGSPASSSPTGGTVVGARSAGTAVPSPPAAPPVVTDAGGPVRVPVSGDTADVHDPALAKEGGTYYLFSTHGGIQVRTSTDLVHWRRAGDVFPTLPAWIHERLPDNPGDLWAPDVSFWGGQWHLYYAASVWLPGQPATRSSAIGHATTPTLDPTAPGYGWTDHGPVVTSAGTFVGATDTTGWNAIDPSVTLDEHGDPWLAWGSAFDGIFVQRLGQDGNLLPGSQPVDLARRGTWFSVVEAAQLVHHDGAWWLFTSYDFCCQGVRSTYNVRVGRADAITGPYLDRNGESLVSPRDGRPLDQDAGAPVLAGYGDVVGPGHEYVFADGDRWWLVHHWYDPGHDGRPELGIRPLDWGPDGWPVARGWTPALPRPTVPPPAGTAPPGTGTPATAGQGAAG